MRKTVEIPRWVLGVGMVVVLALVPAVGWAADRFADVPADSPFHDDINAIAAAGVTQGCQEGPPALYCPDEDVTRAQMAAFLNRLGALSGQEPVVNADTVDGMDADDFVGAVESITLLERSRDFTLEGGANHECVQTASLTFEPDFSVIHQLHATPQGIEPWQVNVTLDTSGLGEGQYRVCFSTLDGSTLPGGTYETFGLMSLP